MIRTLKKLVLSAVQIRRLRSLRALLRNAAVYTQPVSEYRPGGDKVMVLAPHMDDEVVGCGGTIAAHVQAGAHVKIVFLTDGRHGSATHAALVGIERERRQLELIDIRKAEARRAAETLGVRDLVFLDAEDLHLREDQRAVLKLRQLFEREPPDLVYLPFILERHVDHRATSDVLMAAIHGTDLNFECRGYEVSTPLFPNCVVAIDATIELKRRALECYRSQLVDMDYVHIAIGLSAYRSFLLGSGARRFAEAFVSLPLAEYRRYHDAAGRFA